MTARRGVTKKRLRRNCRGRHGRANTGTRRQGLGAAGSDRREAPVSAPTRHAVPDTHGTPLGNGNWTQTEKTRRFFVRGTPAVLPWCPTEAGVAGTWQRALGGGAAMCRGRKGGPARSPSRGRGGEAAGTRGAATSRGPHSPVSVLRATSRAAQAEARASLHHSEGASRAAAAGQEAPGPLCLPPPRRPHLPHLRASRRQDRPPLLLAPRHLEGRAKAPRLRPAPASCVRAAPASARQWPH